MAGHSWATERTRDPARRINYSARCSSGTVRRAARVLREGATIPQACLAAVAVLNQRMALSRNNSNNSCPLQERGWLPSGGGVANQQPQTPALLDDNFLDHPKLVLRLPLVCRAWQKADQCVVAGLELLLEVGCSTRRDRHVANMGDVLFGLLVLRLLRLLQNRAHVVDRLTLVDAEQHSLVIFSAFVRELNEPCSGADRRDRMVLQL